MSATVNNIVALDGNNFRVNIYQQPPAADTNDKRLKDVLIHCLLQGMHVSS
jgi:hypothetical protein